MKKIFLLLSVVTVLLIASCKSKSKPVPPVLSDSTQVDSTAADSVSADTLAK